MADESLKKGIEEKKEPVSDNNSVEDYQSEDEEMSDSNGTDAEDEDAMTTALSGRY